MKTKYPKAFELWWVRNCRDYREATIIRELCHRAWKDAPGKQPYHPHPGNEVARALNVLEHSQPSCLKYNPTVTVDILETSGFCVRWDAKKGRFV